MQNNTVQLSQSMATGKLGVMHLKRYWEKAMLKRSGGFDPDPNLDEWNIDITLLAILGLGLEQTIRQLYSASGDFGSFETWVLDVNKGHLNQEKIEAFNAYILSRDIPYLPDDNTIKVLTEDDLRFWNEQGYVILRNAVPKEDCETAINLICDFIDIDRNDPTSWYRSNPNRQGIMVQLFQHSILEKNRRSARIRKAYEQLWQRRDLWLNTDRVGFNPPETETWKFPGPDLHFDISLATPIPFGLAGLLYLSDTAADQGAFTLVPGFHLRVEKWLQSIPAGTNPRDQDMHELGTKAIAANAGDLIIWHHILPHGSSPNRNALPRFVQYVNYAPLNAEVSAHWI